MKLAAVPCILEYKYLALTNFLLPFSRAWDVILIPHRSPIYVDLPDLVIAALHVDHTQYWIRSYHRQQHIQLRQFYNRWCNCPLQWSTHTRRLRIHGSACFGKLV